MIRNIHRWAGIATAGFILLAVVTGLLWAYAPHFYWAAGYKEKKAAPPSPDFAAARIAPNAAIHASGLDASTVESVELKKDAGRLVYVVRGASGALVDAIDGKVLSPLSESLAAVWGAQYVPRDFTLAGVEMKDSFVARDKTIHDAVAIVRFQQGGGTEIILDRATGSLIEDQDRVRRLHFWVMRLHMLSFFGFKKELTILPGLGMLLMLITGLIVFPRVRAPKRKRR